MPTAALISNWLNGWVGGPTIVPQTLYLPGADVLALVEAGAGPQLVATGAGVLVLASTGSDQRGVSSQGSDQATLTLEGAP